VTAIAEGYAGLFEKPAIASVPTLLPAGAPHVTPTWIDREEAHVLVNTVLDNRKDRNVRADPRIAIAIADPEKVPPGPWRGGRTPDPREHLDVLSERYTGEARYPGPAGERVVRPDAVSGQSPPRR
jgi:hypothetical protein